MRKILFSLLLLVGCSQAPQIIEKQVPVIVEVPAITDTFELEEKREADSSLIYIGVVRDSLLRELGNIKLFFDKRAGVLNLKPRTDTITVTLFDTVLVKQTEIIPILDNSMLWYEKVIIYTALGFIVSFLIYLRVKRLKV